MTKKVILPSFFNRDSHRVARDLLGAWLVGPGGRGRIVEVEVYDGHKDRGSHASRGKTARNRPMFGPAGHWYVYFTYGMHWMLNAVTREEGYPAAVLIRALDIAPGPARLTRALGVDKQFNERPISKESGLWIEAGALRKGEKIKTAARVGIAYAGPYWASRKWRYYLINEESGRVE